MPRLSHSGQFPLRRPVAKSREDPDTRPPMKPRTLLSVVVCLSTLFSIGPVLAQEPPPPIKPEFFKQRRLALH